WQDSFTIGLGGNLTTVAPPGILNASVDVGAKVVFDDPSDGVEQANARLRLFAAGETSIWGMPLGRAGALLSFSDVFAPQFNFAFEAPAADNPLGFLFPAPAPLGVRLSTEGVLEAPIVALRAFVDELASSASTQLT